MPQYAGHAFADVPLSLLRNFLAQYKSLFFFKNGYIISYFCQATACSNGMLIKFGDFINRIKRLIKDLILIT